MQNQIPTDPKEKAALVDMAHKRYTKSTEYFQPWHEKWVRYYKVYRAIQDEVEDSDEPNTFLPYAFGIVENIVAKATEPLFAMKPPCKVRPKRNGDEEAADKFSSVATNYFSSSAYQLDKIASSKERIITGSSWELDDWANDYVEGKMWGKVKKRGMMESITSMLGKVIPLADSQGYDYEAVEAVPRQIPLKIGYNTKFPSVFKVHPQPNVKKVEDMQWIVHEVSEASIADLQKKQYTDPATGMKMPVYDFTELLADAQNHAPGSIVPTGKWGETDYEEEAKQALSARDEKGEDSNNDGVDRIWYVDVYERDRVYTVAQGKYVIRCVKDWLHKPRLPWRHQVYTIDPQFLPGIGAIEPIEDMVYELNDIHNLSMSNWIRIINRMLAYQSEAVPFPDDFKPRAGGKIRVRSDTDPRTAIMSIDQPDVSGSMLNMESNSRGLIEWATSVSDLSPGSEGTKQTHKTATGLIEIQQNMNTRFVMVQRIELANYQAQMESMEEFFSQFQFDKVNYRQYRDDGSTALAEFSKDDIYTEGRGFDYIIEIDPSAGDDAVARAQLIGVFDIALKYENWRLSASDPEAKKIVLSNIMQKILMKFGWSDTSSTLVNPGGEIDPGQELEMMMQGLPVQVNPAEDLIGHLLEHIIQKQSPKLAQAGAAGKVNPQTSQMLDMHIAETMQAIQMIISDPVKAAQFKMQSAIMSQTKGGNGVQPSETTQ